MAAEKRAEVSAAQKALGAAAGVERRLAVEAAKFTGRAKLDVLQAREERDGGEGRAENKKEKGKGGLREGGGGYPTASSCRRHRKLNVLQA